MTDALAYLRDKIDQALRLPAWAESLPEEQRRLIKQANYMATNPLRARYDRLMEEAADRIMYGAPR